MAFQYVPSSMNYKARLRLGILNPSRISIREMLRV